MTQPRLLFSSYHCYLDSTSGAARATRDLLELLTEQGWDCRVLCGPQRDFVQGSVIAELSVERLEYESKKHCSGSQSFELHHSRPGGIPTAIYDPITTPYSPPEQPTGEVFLALFNRSLSTWKPHLVLTYGGHLLARRMIQGAAGTGYPVVFALHNFAYHDANLFQGVRGILVPSTFAQRHYERTLGLNCVPIPSPINWTRCVVEDSSQRRYVTFVNPDPNKGVFIFARVAAELGRIRPDIPLLVVESRGSASWLDRTGIDLRSHPNLHIMANTPDPREFYRVSRVVLMPSLWNESFGRVAAEAMINGIPVLGSDRGALPEVIGANEFLFTVPKRFTPSTTTLPSVEDIEPWLQTILRLWDDPVFYAKASQQTRQRAEQWSTARVANLHDEFFRSLVCA